MINNISTFLLAASPLMLLATFILVWLTVGSLVPRPWRFRALFCLALGGAVGFLILVRVPFTLWAFGTLPDYNEALGAALVTGLMILAACWFLMSRGLATVVRDQ